MKNSFDEKILEWKYCGGVSIMFEKNEIIESHTLEECDACKKQLSLKFLKNLAIKNFQIQLQDMQ